MKTLICHSPGEMEYIERTIPVPAENEALLKIKAVGICGTDIHAFAGRQPFSHIRGYWGMKFAAKLSLRAVCVLV
jgi:threonine dehydrogenase-like Zn-dependent dehydrogenase